MQNPSKLRHLRRTSCLQARHNRSALTVDRIFPFGSPKGDWSNQHVEKDPYPNGRSTRRHEDQLLLVNCHSLRPVSLEQFNSQHWTWQGWSYRLPREHLPGIPGGSPKDGTSYPNTKKNEGNHFNIFQCHLGILDQERRAPRRAPRSQEISRVTTVTTLGSHPSVDERFHAVKEMPLQSIQVIGRTG